MRFPLETRFADYDVAGHVNNAIYFTYFEIARVKAWRTLADAPDDVTFVVAEAWARYASRARLGDPLEIEIGTADVGTRSWTWTYRVVDARDERLVAEGRTVQVMYDLARGASVPIPDGLRERLADV